MSLTVRNRTVSPPPVDGATSPHYDRLLVELRHAQERRCQLLEEMAAVTPSSGRRGNYTVKTTNKTGPKKVRFLEDGTGNLHTSVFGGSTESVGSLLDSHHDLQADDIDALITSLANYDAGFHEAPPHHQSASSSLQSASSSGNCWNPSPRPYHHHQSASSSLQSASSSGNCWNPSPSNYQSASSSDNCRNPSPSEYQSASSSGNGWNQVEEHHVETILRDPAAILRALKAPVVGSMAGGWDPVARDEEARRRVQDLVETLISAEVVEQRKNVVHLEPDDPNSVDSGSVLSEELDFDETLSISHTTATSSTSDSTDLFAEVSDLLERSLQEIRWMEEDSGRTPPAPKPCEGHARSHKVTQGHEAKREPLYELIGFKRSPPVLLPQPSKPPPASPPNPNPFNPTRPPNKSTKVVVNPQHPRVNPANPCVNPTNPFVNPIHSGVNYVNTTHPGLNPANPFVNPTNPRINLANSLVNPVHPSVNPINPTKSGVNPPNPFVNPVNPDVWVPRKDWVPPSPTPTRSWSRKTTLPVNQSSSSSRKASGLVEDNPIYGRLWESSSPNSSSSLNSSSSNGDENKQPEQQQPADELTAIRSMARKARLEHWRLTGISGTTAAEAENPETSSASADESNPPEGDAHPAFLSSLPLFRLPLRQTDGIQLTWPPPPIPYSPCPSSATTTPVTPTLPTFPAAAEPTSAESPKCFGHQRVFQWPVPANKRNANATTLIPAGSLPEKQQRPMKPASLEAAQDWYWTAEFPSAAGLEPGTGNMTTWFHGGITRWEAENRLANQPAGAFLARLTERLWGYALSVRNPAGSVSHFLIDAGERRRHKKYTLLGSTDPPQKSLRELIQYYGKHTLTPEGQEKLLFSCPQEGAVGCQTASRLRH